MADDAPRDEASTEGPAAAPAGARSGGDPARPTPWFANGLRFRCTACGACCTGAPGYVWVEPAEIERMAEAKGLSRRRFERRYVRRVGRRLSLVEGENGDCVMLGADRRCTVYEAKPVRCSTFPFWPESLGGPEAWQETRERCEGVDRGDLYGPDEILRLAAGDPEPLLRRQATAADETSGPDWDAALEDLDRLYRELEAELPRYGFTCAASGRCCDFDAYGHRLYVTTLEAERFFRRAPEARANEDPRLCPAFGKDRLCHARDARMLGCRTYHCGPYPVRPPDDVYERYLARLKAIHDRHRIPYAYRDVVQWAAERRPAAPST